MASRAARAFASISAALFENSDLSLMAMNHFRCLLCGRPNFVATKVSQHIVYPSSLNVSMTDAQLDLNAKD